MNNNVCNEIKHANELLDALINSPSSETSDCIIETFPAYLRVLMDFLQGSDFLFWGDLRDRDGVIGLIEKAASYYDRKVIPVSLEGLAPTDLVGSIVTMHDDKTGLDYFNHKGTYWWNEVTCHPDKKYLLLFVDLDKADFRTAMALRSPFISDHDRNVCVGCLFNEPDETKHTEIKSRYNLLFGLLFKVLFLPENQEWLQEQTK